MQGIESHIQRVSIDDRTYHRVRIGPIDDLEELNCQLFSTETGICKVVFDLKARLDCINLKFCFPAITELFYWLRSQCN